MKILEDQFKKLTQVPVSMNRRAVLMREALWRCVRFDGAYWNDNVLEDAYQFWVVGGRPKCVDVYRTETRAFAMHVRRTTE